jgi:hypothetical protein
MTQKQLDEKELQEILELCEVADLKMKEIGGSMAVILEKTQQWTSARRNTSSSRSSSISAPTRKPD